MGKTFQYCQTKFKDFQDSKKNAGLFQDVATLLDYNVRIYNAARFLAESLTALRNCAESGVVFKCFAFRCIAIFVTSKYVRITNALSFQF